MELALRAAKCTSVVPPEHGLFIVDGPTGVRYAIWVTTRSPEMDDYYLTYPRTRQRPPSIGVIVGSTALLEPLRIARLAWLTEICDIRCVDEDDMFDVARGIQAGTL